MISPSWTYCLSYEFELRKEAIRLCKEQSFGIQSALWTTLRNMEHRMKHWLQLVAIPNAPSSSSSQELQSLKKRISDLEKHALAHHDGTIKSNSHLPAVLRCSLFLLLRLPHRDRRVARAGKEVVSNSQRLRVQAKVRLPRTSIILCGSPTNFDRTFTRNFIRTKFATISRGRLASARMGPASSRMYAWAVAVRSLTTTASASLRSSPDLHLLQSLIQFPRFILPRPFPRLFPL